MTSLRLFHSSNTRDAKDQVSDLLPDTDVALADQDSSVVDRLGQAELEDLQQKVQNLINLGKQLH